MPSAACSAAVAIHGVSAVPRSVYGWVFDARLRLAGEARVGAVLLGGGPIGLILGVLGRPIPANGEEP